MTPARGLLAEVARAWAVEAATLRVIGATALALQVDYDRGTKDADVLRATGLSDEAATHLLDLAGPGTPLAKRWRLHVELVPNGIPFLPHGPVWREISLPDAPSRITVLVLDVVDVVVSKLKRFHANDRADVGAMIAAGHVEHARFVERFRSAVDEFIYDARAEELPRYIANFHEVERDVFGVEESEIDLPSWVE